MVIDRRTLLCSAVTIGMLRAQEESAPSKPKPVPTIDAKVTKLFKSPELHPNDLETAEDGLWIGDQVSEVVNKVDWKTGETLLSLHTEAHNTSGLAIGDGYIWISCNGGVSNRRPPRPNDRPIAEILQADLTTGKTVKWHQPPWGSGIHGITFNEQARTLWVAAVGVGVIVEMDPKDLRILHMIPVKGDRAHGLDFRDGVLWVVMAGDRTVQKIDPKTGKVAQILRIAPESPDPHGLAVHQGNLYYCDAGLTAVSAGTAPGYICRIDSA